MNETSTHMQLVIQMERNAWYWAFGQESWFTDFVPSAERVVSAWVVSYEPGSR